MSDQKNKNMKNAKLASAAKVEERRAIEPEAPTEAHPPQTEAAAASSQPQSEKPKFVKPGKAARAARVAEKVVEVSTQPVMDAEENKQPEGEKSKADLRRERKAIQEAQRLKKGGPATSIKPPGTKVDEPAPVQVKQVTPPKEVTISTVESQFSQMTVTSKTIAHEPIASSIGNLLPNKSKLFHHFDQFKRDYSIIERCNIDSPLIHPAFQKFGIECANDRVVGSNERCLGFLQALKKFVNDYKEPSSQSKSISKDLESKLKPNINFLCQCRPLAVSVANAIKEFKQIILYFPPEITESEAKEILNDEIERFIDEKILLAWETISKYTLADSDTVISGTSYVKSKITNDDCILVYGASTLVTHLLVQASRKFPKLRVIVVDSRPKLMGKLVMEQLVKHGINCTYVLINGISFIMHKVTKVIMGAHALLANGYVMSNIGSSQIALVAKSFNVPVVICCETYKFCDKVQTDALINNELDDPSKMISSCSSKQQSPLVDWKQDTDSINLLNLTYDITAPSFISCVITDMGMLPCTSVPVVLRLKNRDYLNQCVGAKKSFSTEKQSEIKVN